MNVVILGCGYVGRAVAARWRSIHQVTVTTTTLAKVAELEPLAHRVEVIRSEEVARMRLLLQNQHLLLLSVGAPHPNAYESTYLQTAKTIISLLPDLPDLRQIIYTGSYAVYGDQQGAWVDETTAIAPIGDKGQILAETENLLLSAATPTRQVCVFRLGGIFGPGRELTQIFRRAVGTTRPGDGQDAANWVHLDDIVGAIDFASHQALTGIYNLVCTEPTTTGAVLDQVCRQLGAPPVVWDTSQPSQRPYNARVSNQKLRDAGYRFQYDRPLTI